MPQAFVAVFAALRARTGLGRGKADARPLDSHVRSARTKLEAAEGRRRIIAVRGVGFRLLPDDDLDH